MFYPNNFFYFITSFTLAIAGGVYLLITNRRNYLLLLNALLFLLCAIRICTEYYLPEIETYENAKKLMFFHRIVILIFTTSLFTLIWFYIRPFSGRKWEDLGNKFYFWGILILPYPFLLYCNFSDTIYEVNPEKIAGFWKFSMFTSLQAYLQSFILIGILTINLAAMLVEVTRNKKNRFQKIIALLCLLLLPSLINYLIFPVQTDKWRIPNMGLSFLIFTGSVTWFVSNYRSPFNFFSKTINDLLDSISDLAIYTDTTYEISHINKLAEQTFSTKIINQPLATVLKEHSSITNLSMLQLIQQLVNEPQKSNELILIVRGDEKIYNLKVAKFEQGNLHLGYTFLFTDLTEDRAKERQLEQANATKDQLFAIIGHDLRKPALAFRGISKKVNYLIQAKDNNRIQKLGESLEQSALSLNNLLDNLLKWALSQKDFLTIQAKPQEIQPIIAEILDLFAQTLLDKKIKFNVSIAPNVKVFGDKDTIATIFRNLVDNAIKFTPKQGQINLTIQPKAQQVSFKLADTGIGIPTAQLPQLFKLPLNKSRQGTAGEKGAGLGLSLVKDLVDLNKGIITVESQLQQGTTFEVLLPAA